MDINGSMVIFWLWGRHNSNCAIPLRSKEMNVSEIRNIALALAANKKTPPGIDLYEDYDVLEATLSLDNQPGEPNTRHRRNGSPTTIVIEL